MAAPDAMGITFLLARKVDLLAQNARENRSKQAGGSRFPAAVRVPFLLNEIRSFQRIVPFIVQTSRTSETR
jgi:hypothetical protein